MSELWDNSLPQLGDAVPRGEDGVSQPRQVLRAPLPLL